MQIHNGQNVIKAETIIPNLINRNVSADEYSRAQSSSVSPRGGGYCSSASTPGSGGYGTASINGYGPPITGISSASPVSSANVFNSTSSKTI